MVDCHLIHRPIASKKSMEALSYMCGKKDVNNEILVDGVRILVRQNLYQALRPFEKRANHDCYGLMHFASIRMMSKRGASKSLR